MNPLHRRRFLQTGALTATAALALPDQTPAAGKPAVKKGPKFRLGLVTWNLAAKWELPTLLKVCKATGISPVELRTTHAHKVEPSLGKDRRKEVRKRFADSEVELWGCGTTCEFHSTSPAEVKKQIETCK